MAEERIEDFETIVADAAKQHGYAPTQDQIDLVLWSCTAFPVCSFDTVVRHVSEFFAMLVGFDARPTFDELLAANCARIDDEALASLSRAQP